MIRSSTAMLSLVALFVVSGCNREAEVPLDATSPTDAIQGSVATPVSYVCDSGQMVSVVYPDGATAALTYRGQTHLMRQLGSASGALYTGSGFEWQTETRDGRDAATLRRAGVDQTAASADLERCNLPLTEAAPAAAQTALADSAGGASATPIPPPCRGPQLTLAVAGTDAGMGNRIAMIEVRNVGNQVCSLTGYPAVSVQDSRSRPIATVRAERSAGGYLRRGQDPGMIALEPQGKGWFDLAWNVVPHQGQGETVCPVVATVRVIVPGDTSPVPLAQSLTPCGGRIGVSPFRADAEPATAGTAPATKL